MTVTLQIATSLRFGELAVTVTAQILISLRLGELAVNSNSPIFSVVELSRVSPNFMYTECFLSLQYVLENAFCFCVGLILLFTHMPNGNSTK